MKNVQSKDGTKIAYEQTGEGPALILVGGASMTRSSHYPLAEILSKHFTVYNYDRRGRVDSGNTLPYAVQREIEDIDALIQEAGGSAYLYGMSSGAVLALEAAASGLTASKLVLWEPPFILDGSHHPSTEETADVLDKMVEEGHRAEAAEYFMSDVIGIPQEAVVEARKSQWWPQQVALAHTLSYDVRITSDYSLLEGRAANVTAPTLVMYGGKSFPWMEGTAKALTDLLLNGKLDTLPDQTHGVDSAAIAPFIEEFLLVSSGK